MVVDVSKLYKCITEFNQSDMVIERWNNVLQVIASEGVIVEKELDENMRDKYLFDFDGLLRNEFQIPFEYLYPTYIINGIRSSIEYDGSFKTIKLVDPSTMAKYKDMVTDKTLPKLSTYFN